MARYEQFLTNTAANVIFRLFSACLGLILTPLFVRRLGTEAYAIWVLNLTIINYFYLMEGSCGGAIVKHVAEAEATNDKAELASVVQTALAVYGVFGLVVFAVTMGCGHWLLAPFYRGSPHHQTAANLLSISGLAAIIMWPSLVFPSVLRGQLRFVTLNWIQGVGALLTQLVVIGAVTWGARLEVVALGFYCASMVTTIALLWAVGQRMRGWRPSAKFMDRALFVRILRFSSGLFLLELLSMLGYQSDRLIIAYFLPLSAVTTYDVVTKMFYVLRSIYGSLLGVIEPLVFAASRRQDLAFVGQMAVKGTKIVTVVYTPVIVLGMVVAGPFLKTWMGGEYARYGYWSALYISHYLLPPIVGVIGTVAIGMSRLRAMQRLSAMAVLLNVAISVAGVKMFGFEGALVGTVTSSYLFVAIAYVVYCRTVGIAWRAPIRENALSLAILIGVFLAPGIWCAPFIVQGWWSLAAFVGGFLIAEYVVLFWTALDRSERTRLLTYAIGKGIGGLAMRDRSS